MKTKTKKKRKLKAFGMMMTKKMRRSQILEDLQEEETEIMILNRMKEEVIEEIEGIKETGQIEMKKMILIKGEIIDMIIIKIKAEMMAVFIKNQDTEPITTITETEEEITTEETGEIITEEETEAETIITIIRMETITIKGMIETIIMNRKIEIKKKKKRKS